MLYHAPPGAGYCSHRGDVDRSAFFLCLPFVGGGGEGILVDFCADAAGSVIDKRGELKTMDKVRCDDV